MTVTQPPRRTALMQLSSTLTLPTCALTMLSALSRIERCASMPTQSTHTSAPRPSDASRMNSMGSVSAALTTSALAILRAISRRYGSTSTPMTRFAPRSHALFMAMMPTGPQPKTATISPPFDPGPVDAAVARRENVRQEKHLLVGQRVGHLARAVIGVGHADELRLAAVVAAVEVGVTEQRAALLGEHAALRAVMLRGWSSRSGRASRGRRRNSSRRQWGRGPRRGRPF